MKTLDNFGFTLLLLAGGLIFAGDYLGLPWLARVALITVGLIACIGGTRIMREGVAYEGKTHLSDPRHIRRYTGISARLIGIIILLAGCSAIGLSIMDLISPGGANAFLSGLLVSNYGQALILGMAGVIITAFGITRAISGSATSHAVYGPIVEFSLKAGGVISVLIGLVMLMLAAGLILIPELLAELFDQTVSLFKSLILNP